MDLNPLKWYPNTIEDLHFVMLLLLLLLYFVWWLFVGNANFTRKMYTTVQCSTCLCFRKKLWVNSIRRNDSLLCIIFQLSRQSIPLKNSKLSSNNLHSKCSVTLVQSWLLSLTYSSTVQIDSFLVGCWRHSVVSCENLKHNTYEKLHSFNLWNISTCNLNTYLKGRRDRPSAFSSSFPLRLTMFNVAHSLSHLLLLLNPPKI